MDNYHATARILPRSPRLHRERHPRDVLTASLG